MFFYIIKWRKTMTMFNIQLLFTQKIHLICSVTSSSSAGMSTLLEFTPLVIILGCLSPVFNLYSFYHLTPHQFSYRSFFSCCFNSIASIHISCSHFLFIWPNYFIFWHLIKLVTCASANILQSSVLYLLQYLPVWFIDDRILYFHPI